MPDTNFGVGHPLTVQVGGGQSVTITVTVNGPPIEDPVEQGAPYLRADGQWPGAVTRTTDERPLSHQNDFRYVLNPAFSDDFSTFDTSKWGLIPSGPFAQGESLGRIPSRFWPNNVNVTGGELQIRMHEVNPLQTDPEADDFDPATTMDQPTSYGGWTSGCFLSHDFVLYGYFEIRAKIMPSAGSSAFWLAWPESDELQTEIDVFEMGGKGTTPDPAGDELPHITCNNRYNMNYHVFESAQFPGVEGYNEDRTWVAPFDFADEYHVYGFDWQPDFCRWYVDGVLIHVKPTRDQHTPMRVILDSEAFWGGEADGGWFGFPDPADFPSLFKIEYIRAWSKIA
jgi:beta-glucanase (GH16 family)